MGNLTQIHAAGDQQLLLSFLVQSSLTSWGASMFCKPMLLKAPLKYRSRDTSHTRSFEKRQQYAQQALFREYRQYFDRHVSLALFVLSWHVILLPERNLLKFLLLYLYMGSPVP